MSKMAGIIWQLHLDMFEVNQICDELRQKYNVYATEVQITTAIATIQEKVDKIEVVKNSRNNFMWLRLSLIPERIVKAVTVHLSFLFQLKIALPITFLSLLVVLYCIYKLGIYPKITANYWVSAILFLISAIFHEFGHASASTFYKTSPKDIGFGIYLIYPVLYADVSRVWKLEPLQRAVVDMGGMYFQLIICALIAVYGALTSDPSAHASVMLIIFSIVFSANPFLKFDGYWLVSDFLNIKDLDKKPLFALNKVIHLRSGYDWFGANHSRQVTAFLMIYTLFYFCFWIYLSISLFNALYISVKSFLINIQGLSDESKLVFNLNVLANLLSVLMLLYFCFNLVRSIQSMIKHAVEKRNI